MDSEEATSATEMIKQRFLHGGDDLGRSGLGRVADVDHQQINGLESDQLVLDLIAEPDLMAEATDDRRQPVRGLSELVPEIGVRAGAAEQQRAAHDRLAAAD